MGWIAPIWLLGLASLALPVLLHLRRRRIGRRVLVGSVRHLEGSAPPRTRRPAIRDPWLLALRLAVLTATVLGLAIPVIRANPPRPVRWVLVAPALLADTLALNHDALLDSLRSGGTQIRSLEPGFPPLADASAPASGQAPDLWSLVAEADASLPPGSRITIVVPSRRSLLRGVRPRTASDVVVTTVGRTEPGSWIEAAWTSGDSGTAVLADAAHGGVSRQLVQFGTAPGPTVPGAPVPDSPVHAWRAGSVWHVTPATGAAGAANAVALGRVPVRIAATPGRASDARYMSAAIRTVAEALGIPIALAPVTSNVTPPPGPGLTVWLGHTAATLPRLPPGATLFAAEPADGNDSAQPATAPAELPTISSDTVITDRFARPLLRQRRAGDGTAYIYRGRSGLVRSGVALEPAFPRMLARLWAAALIGLAAGAGDDHLDVAAGQLAPTHVAPQAATGTTRELGRMLLALAAVLFIVERAVAHRLRR